MQQTINPDTSAAIVELLSDRRSKARFVLELCEALRRSGTEPGAVEGALAGLERDGRVLVRDHACADPHLEGADLRIAALIDARDG